MKKLSFLFTIMLVVSNVTPALSQGNVSFFNGGSSKEASIQEEGFQFNIGAGGGYFQFSNKTADGMYGYIPFGKISMERRLSKNFRLTGGVLYMAKEGEPITEFYGDNSEDYYGTLKMTMLNFNIGLAYIFPVEDGNLFVEAGLKQIRMNEELNIYKQEFGVNRIMDWVEEDFNSTDPYVSVGGELLINQDNDIFAYLEISYFSAEIDGYMGSTEIGGTSFEAGIKKFFE